MQWAVTLNIYFTQAMQRCLVGGASRSDKECSMATYEPGITAVLCVDLYNDFLSEGGKLFPWVKDIARENNMHESLRSIVRTAREAGIAIYHVPHHRWEPGDYLNWKYPSPYQLGDIVATEHWASSGFPNTDLDHQLKRHGKEKLILIGLLANTCLEATARIGMELGYHVTLVRDATSARSHEALHAAMNIDGPTYAHEILTTAEVVAAMKGSNQQG